MVKKVRPEAKPGLLLMDFGISLVATNRLI